MVNDYRQLALTRLDIFQNEGRERDFPTLSNNEYVRLKTFFVNDLSKKYGRDITNATFDDLLSDLMGSGINTIEQYIQSSFSAFPLFGEEQPDLSPEKNDSLSSDDEKKEDIQPSVPNEEQTHEKQIRTRKRDTGMYDICWTPASSAKANTKKAKELRNKIACLEKDRDILHRQFSLYRPDYAIIQGIIEYGKKGNTPLECNGLSLDNQQNVIHAALENLIKDLQASKKTECFQNIKKYREMSEEETDIFNQKITKLKKELQKLIGQ